MNSGNVMKVRYIFCIMCYVFFQWFSILAYQCRQHMILMQPSAAFGLNSGNKANWVYFDVVQRARPYDFLTITITKQEMRYGVFCIRFSFLWLERPWNRPSQSCAFVYMNFIWLEILGSQVDALLYRFPFHIYLLIYTMFLNVSSWNASNAF